MERLGDEVTVNPIKLETGIRPNSAGIPYTLLLGIEAIGFPTFGLLLYIIVGRRSSTQRGQLQCCHQRLWGLEMEICLGTASPPARSLSIAIPEGPYILPVWNWVPRDYFLGFLAIFIV